MHLREGKLCEMRGPWPQQGGEKDQELEGPRNVKICICCYLKGCLSHQLTLLTASRSLRPDMVLGVLREEHQPPEMQGARAEIAGWTRKTPPEIHMALAALLSSPEGSLPWAQPKHLKAFYRHHHNQGEAGGTPGWVEKKAARNKSLSYSDFHHCAINSQWNLPWWCSWHEK